jgi:TolB-like protein/Tfp pilus assembly protein PilF
MSRSIRGEHLMSDVPAYQRFLAELKRRHVFRIMVVYGAVGFVLLQVVELLVPALLLPEWTYRFVALLLLVGFPIAIVLAWAFESTPDGVKRTDEVSEDELAAIVSAPPGKRWPAGVMALVATGLFVGAVWMGLKSSGDIVSESEADEAVPVSTAASTDPGSVAPDSEASRQSVAVLPFADLAGTEDSKAFALGLHDDLMTQLTQVPDLKVTSRTSVMAYEGQNRPVNEIARELGVGSVVEGGVRTSGGRVRLNVQLIDPATDEHLWAQTFDRELTAENVFEIQGEIALAVATALEVELSAETGEALGAVLTDNIEAWNAFHEGRLLEDVSGNPERDFAAVEAYERAVALDPEFVAAWARLVLAQSWLLRRGLETDTLPAFQSLERLRALDPGGVDALYGEGVYRYYAHADYPAALEALYEAGVRRPGDPEIMQREGWVLRRMGRWSEAMELLDRAIQLDPRNSILMWNQGTNNYRLRRYGIARRQYEIALEIEPSSGAAVRMVDLVLFSEGDSAAAREILKVVRELALPGRAEAADYWQAYMRRDYDAAIDAARRITDEPAGIAPASGAERYHSNALRLATAYHLKGDEANARSWADSAVTEALSELAIRPSPEPRDLFGAASMAHAHLGLALALRAGPGDADEAIRHAEEAVHLHGYEDDAADSAIGDWFLVRTCVLTGRYDEAIERMENMLSRPSIFGLGDLKLDPLYDPLRSDPRYQALIPRLEQMIEW